MTAHTNNNPAIVLIPGHWLGAWAWDEVTAHLASMGRRAVPITLPGLDNADPDRSSRTLEDQVVAVEQILAAEAVPAIIVAHSGANVPVSVVLDRHPERVRRVIWVDSGPVANGSIFMPGAPEGLQELPLPPFEVLGKQASLEGLTDAMLDRFRALAVPEPGPVLRQQVALDNDERLAVPTTLICCSIASGQVRGLAAQANPMFAEVARLENVEFTDLPTGHWPMWSRASELADVIAEAGRSQPS